MTPAERAQALLTTAEMTRADAAAIASGRSGQALMESAGRAVAEACRARWQPRPAVVLCGPGNNGGDGFVAARLLAAAGWPVRIALLGERDALKGDAAHQAGLWSRRVERLGVDTLQGAELVIDALFGAGLSRPVEGVARQVIEAIVKQRLPTVAVDVPSGVQGDSGAVLGAAAPAALTVTFFRKKPGHVLLPGRILCGEVLVADIGIPERVLEEIGPTAFENDPALWSALLPRPRHEDHKYRRGHALIAGGTEMTGAARLAAEAARRAGAGLLTILAEPAVLPIYAMAAPGHLVRPYDPDGGLPAGLLSDPRVTALLVGPGAGRGEETRRRALAALHSGKPLVLDADALTVFSARREELLSASRESVVLTPHEGEFRALFTVSGSKLERCRAAAAEAGAVMLLKGADTVIAAPGARAVINANAPPELATGGSGDVLAGILLGLLAQGMPAFDAAAAAVWLHGAAAQEAGRAGLIAEDLAPALRPVLERLFGEQEHIFRLK